MSKSSSKLRLRTHDTKLRTATARWSHQWCDILVDAGGRRRHRRPRQVDDEDAAVARQIARADSTAVGLGAPALLTQLVDVFANGLPAGQVDSLLR